jgi:hypothetical protein
LVTLSGVELAIKKHRVTQITVAFSGPVQAAGADVLANYHLTIAGRHGSFTGRGTKPIALGSAVYSGSTDSVTLRPRKAFALSKPVQIRVNRLAPSELADDLGRLIDGNHDGQAGGDAVAILSPAGARLAARVARGAAHRPVGPAVPAGLAEKGGTDHATIVHQGLTDGVTHSYRFSSTGLDGAGNAEPAHAAPSDVIFSESFAPPSALEVTGLTVEHGAAERSSIRYLDIAFNESDSQSGGQLAQLAGSVGSASPRIQLFKYDLNGTPSSQTTVSFGAPATLAVVDHAIEIDFGGELGGGASTTAADGYYELNVLLPDGQTAVHHFYRLLGDVTGDGVVDNNDLTAIATELALAAPTGYTPLGADVNGDGTVTAFDMTLAIRAKGHRRGSGLPLG